MRTLLIFLLMTLASPVAAQQLSRYPAGKISLPADIMICRTADLVDQQVLITPSEAKAQLSAKSCMLTEETSSANIYFYRSGSTLEYIYDVIELKLWKARANGTPIYLGTFYTLGDSQERKSEEKTNEAPTIAAH